MKRKEYPIHPDFEPLKHLNPPIVKAALPAMQKSMETLWAIEQSGDGVHVEKLEIPVDQKHSVQALLYSPEDAEEILPCLIYFHGGGFVFAAAPHHFVSSRTYCRRAGCRVLLVDYRLAPKHPYPAAVDDAFGAYRWVQKNCEKLGVDPHRIAVGGDSAGGCISAAVCLMARDFGAEVPCGLMMIYPCTDIRMQTESVKKYVDTPMCNSRDLVKYMNLYVPHREWMTQEERVYASPAEAESLAGMPAAYVETAEFDCLHDEGVSFAQRLEEEGSRVQLNETKGTVHGYEIMPGSSVVQECYDVRIRFLERVFTK